MGELMDFTQFQKQPDIMQLGRKALEEYLVAVQSRIEQLDEIEPEDMNSPDYEEWGDKHEELEDLADEIMERLDRMGGRRG